jgi:hypothetical protein
MLVNLRALLVRLIDIVLLRGGPESLPASVSLLVTVVVLNLVVTVVSFEIFPVGPQITAFELIVGTLVPLLWYRAAFVLVNKRDRFVQTMIAFFGSNLLFQPLFAPLLATLLPYLLKQDPNVTPPALASVLLLAVALWALLVLTRIVRAAFEWPTFAAIIFIFGQTMVAILINAVLFGKQAPPA